MHSKLTRRNLLVGVAAAGLTTLASPLASWAAAAVEATLSVDPSGHPVDVPADFTGLSYESAQLSNPHFFSSENHELVALVRGLGNRGVLRLGGGTSDYTRWTGKESPGGPPNAIFGPATSYHAPQETLTTPLAIRNLKAFLDATNWTCLYGLNMARGTSKEAAEEAAYVQQTLGNRLIAFQLGNEPDAWRKRYRPADWKFADYFRQWLEFHAAVLKRVPDARFAGPDVSHKVSWVEAFAEQAHSMIVMLTSHYYAEGPATSPKATLEKLLDPDPKHAAEIQRVMTVATKYKLPYRMSEGNSCWDGGKPGVSNTLGSALWCADMMLQYAQAGCSGVNLHGGGNGYYTPIAGGGAMPLVRRPEYFGMVLAEKFAGARIYPTTANSSNGRITGYFGRHNQQELLAVINTGSAAAKLRLMSPAWRSAPGQLAALELRGPSVTSTQGVSVAPARISVQKSHGSRVITVDPYRAVVCTFPGTNRRGA